MAGSSVRPSARRSSIRQRSPAPSGGNGGYRRRKEITDAVLALTRVGTSIKEIVRRLGLARMTVRRIVRGGGTDVFRSRMSTLEPHLATLDAYRRAGCHNASEIWRRLRDAGFAGSSRVVAEWAKRRRLDEAPMADRRPRKPPSARMVARLLTAERDRIPVAFASTMALIEQGVPTLIAARDLLDRFHAVIRTRAVDELDAWITAARENPLSSFANGIATDRDSVRAALVHPGAPRSRQVQPLGSLQSLPDAPLPAASASAPADRATRHHRLLLSSASTFCRFPAPGR